ncbi:hypothetical protein VIBNISO65_460114 [Vibrio nigripulchritudo SO65]|nr:hypothetical protein VIBNIFTn2_1040114 [Vibrio nigripulchritudo FTn2]CCN78145.1 hypothetical protein VIBNISO65_460114 [Vibrio nigripulchritudo SO65]
MIDKLWIDLFNRCSWNVCKNMVDIYFVVNIYLMLNKDFQ